MYDLSRLSPGDNAKRFCKVGASTPSKCLYLRLARDAGSPAWCKWRGSRYSRRLYPCSHSRKGWNA